MGQKKLMKFLQAAAIGSVVASLFVAVVTIVGEEFPPLKNWLKNTFTHHWLGKSALSIAIFIFVTLWQERVCSGDKVVQAVWWALVAAVVSAVALTGFFILHSLQLV